MFGGIASLISCPNTVYLSLLFICGPIPSFQKGAKIEIVVKFNEKKFFSKYSFFSCNFQEREGFCASDVKQSVPQRSSKSTLRWWGMVGGRAWGLNSTQAPVLLGGGGRERPISLLEVRWGGKLSWSDGLGCDDFSRHQIQTVPTPNRNGKNSLRFTF